MLNFFNKVGGYETVHHNYFGSWNTFTKMLMTKKTRSLRDEQHGKNKKIKHNPAKQINPTWKLSREKM